MMNPGATTRAVLAGMAGLFLVIRPAAAEDVKAALDFVTRASVGNLAAIAESRLALERAGDARLKAYARRLIDDHEAAEAALRAAANGSGATVPTALDAAHQARFATLQGSAGAAFDRTYVADQAEIHSNALTLYADYMLLGDDAKLKALSTGLIPRTEAQFKEARSLSGP